MQNQKKDNNKFKNNQNCQKIKLCGSPTTKELKKKHSFRLVGGAEMCSQGREDAWQGSGWKTRQVRQWLADQAAAGGAGICMWINQEE